MRHNEKRMPPSSGIKKVEKHFKNLLLGFIAFVLFTEIVITNVEKLNTVKNHSVGLTKL